MNSWTVLLMGKPNVFQVNSTSAASSVFAPPAICRSEEFEYHFGHSVALTRFCQITLAGALIKISLWTKASAVLGSKPWGQRISLLAWLKSLTGLAPGSAAT